MGMFTKGNIAQQHVIMESVHELKIFVAVWAFSMLFGTGSDKSTTYIWEIYSDAMKYFDHIGPSRASERHWCSGTHREEGMTWLTAIILFSFILLLKMEWKSKWPRLIGAKIVKWGWVIWFLSVQRSIKKTEYFIVCVLPTPLPKQSALLLLVNMYLANIYNFISYLAALFNLSGNVIRSKEFGRLKCHQETVKTLSNTAVENTLYLLTEKNSQHISCILVNKVSPKKSSLQNHKIQPVKLSKS